MPEYDGYKRWYKMGDIMGTKQNAIIESFQSLFEKQELLAKVIEFFPYPIQIFSPDGTARLINKAALEMIGIRSVESHVGKYNVFKDPIVQKLGFMDQVKQVLTGKTVYITDFNAPYRDMIRYFNVVDRDIQMISSDITCFPLINNDGVVEYFVAVFIFKKVYRGKEEIRLGRQYIEDHWLEPFDLSKTAKVSYLSKAQFTKLFKKHTGLTPHEYYINYKISKLKEKLLDTNLSIAQAFAACNMDYNGHSARMFKQKVGVSPSVYRKMSQ
jgi:AraC family transcriptional regulator